MSGDTRNVLDVLKFELNFLEQGGYGRSVHSPWSLLRSSRILLPASISTALRSGILVASACSPSGFLRTARMIRFPATTYRSMPRGRPSTRSSVKPPRWNSKTSSRIGYARQLPGSNGSARPVPECPEIAVSGNCSGDRSLPSHSRWSEVRSASMLKEGFRRP